MSERIKLQALIAAESDESALDRRDAQAISDINRALKAMGDRLRGLPSDVASPSQLLWSSMFIRQQVSLRRAALTQSPSCPHSGSEPSRAVVAVRMKTMPSAEIRVPPTSTEAEVAGEADAHAPPSEVRKPLARTL